MMHLSAASDDLSFKVAVVMSAFSFGLSVPLVTFYVLILSSGQGNFIAAPAIETPYSFTVLTVAKTTPIPIPPPVPRMAGAVSTPFGTT